MNKEKIILLDRDGIINEDIGYLSNPSSINLYLDVVSFIKCGIEKNYKIFIVTNQSGIGRGFYKEKDFKMVMKSIHKILNSFGIKNLDYFFVLTYQIKTVIVENQKLEWLLNYF